ncbi:MAG TPA: hypothetical protein PLS20_14635, partial [Ruminococcus flavefaciens]|nr:hypothetical protein [Ruminococcus flavefaciens]
MEDSDVVYKNRHAEVDASEIGELIGSAFLSYTHNFTGKVTEGSYDVYSISGISPEYAVAACDDNGRYHFYCNNEFRPASVDDLFEKLDLNDLTFDETANFFNTPFSQHKVDSDRINEILFYDPKLSIKTKLSRKNAYIQLFASNGHDFMGDIILNIYRNGEIDLELNGNNYSIANPLMIDIYQTDTYGVYMDIPLLPNASSLRIRFVKKDLQLNQFFIFKEITLRNLQNYNEFWIYETKSAA